MNQTPSSIADQAAHGAEQFARRGIEALRDGTEQLRYKAAQGSDSTIAYIKQEPVKSVVIAAATGAALLALASMLARGRH